MRFLFKWQHVDAPARLTGLDGLREAIALLDGFELPAGAWERAVLPARLDRYDPSMLDMLCLAGEVGWARLSPRRRCSSCGPATPIALFLREHARRLADAARPATEALSKRRSTTMRGVVLERLRRAGASFFRDLAAGCRFDADRLRRRDRCPGRGRPGRRRTGSPASRC